jgi:hypothetical protein
MPMRKTSKAAVGVAVVAAAVLSLSGAASAQDRVWSNPDGVRITGTGTDGVRITGTGTDGVRITGVRITGTGTDGVRITGMQTRAQSRDQ